MSYNCSGLNPTCGLSVFNTKKFSFKKTYLIFYVFLYVLYLLTLFLFSPTDMPGRKPRPKPLAYSRALIAKEKLAVIRRTALRKQELTGETPSNNPPTVVVQINNWHSCLSTFCFCMLLLVLNLLLWQWLYYNKVKLTKL